jgi:hypothetical protein
MVQFKRHLRYERILQILDTKNIEKHRVNIDTREGEGAYE